MSQYKLNKYLYYKNDGQKCVIANLLNGTIIYLTGEIESSYFNGLTKQTIFNDDEKYHDIFQNLYNNAVIIKEETKESDIVIGRFLNQNKSRKLHLTIFVTESCNFNCGYCFVDRAHTRTITDNTIDRILNLIKKKVKEFGYQEITISWFGGEPLLAANEIKQLLSILNDYCFENNINLSNLMVTNGYLLNLKEFLNIYNAGIKSIQVTFDGDEDLHNSLRKHELYGNTFQKIYLNLLAIKKLPMNDFTIIVRCNYNKKNLHNTGTDDFIKRYIKNFKDDIRFQLQIRPIVEYGSWGENNNEMSTYLGNLAYLTDKTKEYSLFEESLLSMIRPKKIWCSVFNPHNLTINPRGEVYTCDAVISDEKYKMAEINNDGSLSGVTWIGKDGLDQQLSQKCKMCKKLPICFGTCYLIKSRYNHNACFCSDSEIYKLLDYLLENERYV